MCRLYTHPRVDFMYFLADSIAKDSPITRDLEVEGCTSCIQPSDITPSDIAQYSCCLTFCGSRQAQRAVQDGAKTDCVNFVVLASEEPVDATGL